MTIANPEFPIIFLAFICLYWSCRTNVRLQNLFLLVFSYAIYSLLSFQYAAILFALTIFVWTLTTLLAKESLDKSKKTITVLSIVFCLANLAIFKYSNLFTTQAQNLFSYFGIYYTFPIVNLALPVGLSFYTFQAISYICAVYSGKTKPAKLLDFATYLSFAPTILAGPICRPYELLNPIQDKRFTTRNDIDDIVLLISSFFVKKVWLASWLSQSYVNPIFSDPSNYNTFELILGLSAYSLQIYFDFSGYTDLARAVAKILGFNIPQNFDRPYLSNSFSEFWNRWHITLSHWIRDYIYFPLGGSRQGFLFTIVNLIIAMTLSGLWHGASMMFVVWGLYHGVLLCAEKILKLVGVAINNKLIVFPLVTLGWVFFRCESLDSSFTFLKSLANWNYPIDLSLNHFSVVVMLVLSFSAWLHADVLLNLIRSVMKPSRLYLKITFGIIFISAALFCSPEGMPSFVYAQF